MSKEISKNQDTERQKKIDELDIKKMSPEAYLFNLTRLSGNNPFFISEDRPKEAKNPENKKNNTKP